MADSKGASSGGVGFFGLLFLVFLVLKLTKVITWSWWWVTAPLWGGVALWAGIVGLLMLAGLVSILLTSRAQRPRGRRTF